MDNQTILRVKDLTVNFDGEDVLKNVNFQIKRGDIVAIVGPNGAGKSVLFRALLGLIPYSGTIQWQGDIKKSYIPQRFYIDRNLPLSVEEFMNFKKTDTETILKTLMSVGLEDHADKTRGREHLKKHLLKQRLGWLSGGQLQRVFIAWSLLDDPDILLFDEPTSGIDVSGEETIYGLLKRLRDEKHFSILLISHELNIVYRYATNVICLNREMFCYGMPNEVLDPAVLSKLYGDESGFYKHEHQK